jgi:aspartyl-tRNA(Asn)/glutamyl-tRNA(Gln) amidotransferase subunit A
VGRAAALIETMMFQNRSAVALLDTLLAGRVTPDEVEAQTIAAADRGNARLRTFIDIFPDPTASTRPSMDAFSVYGLPLAVKDNIAIAGHRLSAGIAGNPYPVGEKSAHVVARWRALGGRVIGRTNLHEGALGGTSDNPAFGRVDNPAAPGFTPGGSSGGSAAAVAAGILPLALGTDTMGSVRIPASYCGVVGFKPSRGVISRTGVIALSPTLDHVGIFANMIADVEIAVRALADDDALDPHARPLPNCARSPPGSLEGLLFGIPDCIAKVDVEPAVTAAFDNACARLMSAGVTFVPVVGDALAGQRLRKEGFLISEVEGALVHEALLDDPRSGLSPRFRSLLEYGRNLPAPRYASALQTCARIGAMARRAVCGLDAIVTPTTPQRAFRHGETAPANQADFTVFANAAGLPAVSLPMTCEARPAGLQLTGGDLGDYRLLAIARLVEAILRDLASRRD